MKTLMVVAMTALFTAAALAKGIAVVDMEAILEAHPNTPNDKKLLETTLEEFSKERDNLRKLLDEKQAELEKKVKNAQNPMLAPAKATELKKACEAAYQELEQARDNAEMQMQQRSRELSDLERRLIKRTSEEVTAQIKVYAEAQGYDAVVYKNVVPYVSEDLDITQEIIALCGGKTVKKDTSKAASELAPPAKVTPVKTVTPAK